MCRELEGSFVVEQEAMARTRDKKRKKRKKRRETEINRVACGRALRRRSSCCSKCGSDVLLTAGPGVDGDDLKTKAVYSDMFRCSYEYVWKLLNDVLYMTGSTWDIKIKSPSLTSPTSPRRRCHVRYRLRTPVAIPCQNNVLYQAVSQFQAKNIYFYSPLSPERGSLCQGKRLPRRGRRHAPPCISGAHGQHA